MLKLTCPKCNITFKCNGSCSKSNHEYIMKCNPHCLCRECYMKGYESTFKFKRYKINVDTDLLCDVLTDEDRKFLKTHFIVYTLTDT